mmetsp:Transcript_23649/g.63608  ORF Transcript_23649/g.63608 Transcript_23649/m.63608 type:complete len:136 (+) Transcript_23649:929-1336(+)
MNFFRKAAQTGQNLFRKAAKGGQNIFRKGGLGDQFSALTGRAGDALGVAGRETRRFSTNPVTRGTGDFLLGKEKTDQILGTTLAASRGLKGASNLLGQASGLTDRRNLRGNAEQVVGNVLERSKKLKADTGTYFA